MVGTVVSIGPVTKTSPSTSWYAYMETYDQDYAANTSRMILTIRCYNGPNGTPTQSHYEGSGVQWAGIDNVGVVITHARDSGFLPLGYSANQLRWDEAGISNAIGHDANGNLSLNLRMHIQYDTVNEEYVVNLTAPRIPKVPAAPGKPIASNVQPTSMTLTWNIPDGMGSSIDQMLLRYSLDPGFGTYTDLPQAGNVTSKNVTGLNPGTLYYWRVYAHNGAGYGPSSPVTQQYTLPSVGPGLFVVPSASGTQARLSFTAPGGVSGVTKYLWENRTTVTPIPVLTAMAGETTASQTTVTGLGPGLRYDWRAAAVVGSYQSPWSDWQTVAQPRPSTGPGDYFDGSFVSTDLDYAWTGVPHLSTSTATGKVPTGWAATPAGGHAVVARVTAGLYGFSAARISVVRDATGNGSRFGMATTAGHTAEVTEGASFAGSIYARLSRQNRVAAEIAWLDDASAVISRSVGGALLVPAATWSRVYVVAEAPVGAAHAAVTLVDVVGAGSTFWQGGDYLDLDGAMITLGDLYSYFDGATPDTSEYLFAWEGTANASTSSRRPVPIVAPVTGGSLVDPDCPPVPAPPRPPIIDNACIEETGVWRRYFGNIPAAAISDWLAVVPTLEIVTQTELVRQVRLRIYENPLGLPASEVNTNSWRSEQIVSFVPANTKLTLDGVTQRVWAEVNGAAAQAADHLLYGSGGTPATWPILSCGIAYLISVDLPVEVPLGDSKISAYLTTRS